MLKTNHNASCQKEVRRANARVGAAGVRVRVREIGSSGLIILTFCIND